MTAPAWGPLAVPLVAAGVTMLLRGRAVALAGALSTLLTLGAATALAAEVAAGEIVHQRLLAAGGLQIDLHADGFATVLVLVAAVVNVIAAAYALGYSQGPHTTDSVALPESFWPWWLLLSAGMNGVFLLSHLFALYVALELIGAAAVALVALEGWRRPLTAGMHYLVIAVAGSLLYLAGAVLLYTDTGTLDLHRIGDHLDQAAIAAPALAMMTLGLLLTAALFPLHFWLPDAHTLAPAPASPILSALVLKVYFYAVLALWFQALPQVVTPTAAQVLAVCGTAAIAWGGITALRQTSIKRLVAYSTLSQMGYLWLIPALIIHRESVADPESAAWFGWHGGVYYAVAHSSAKAAMLMAAGALARAVGEDHVERLRGAASGAPIAVFAFALAGVNLVGLPPTGGFVGKWYLLTAAISSGQWWLGVVVLAGTGLTAAYVLAVLRRAFTRIDAAPASTGFTRLPRAIEISPLVLALLTVVLGFRAVEVLELLEVGAPPLLGDGPPTQVADDLDGQR